MTDDVAVREAIAARFAACLEALSAPGALDRIDRPTLLFLAKYIEENILVPLAPPGDGPPITSGTDLGTYRRRRHRSIEDCYEAWSEVYGVGEAGLFAREAILLERLLDIEPDLAILDVGCGTGRHALAFAGQGARVTAIDRSAAMLARARRAADDAGLAIRFVESDVLSADLEGPFDLVFSSLAATHIADLGGLLTRLGGWLAGEGRILISDIHPGLKRLGAGVGFIDGRTYHEIEHHTHSVSDFHDAAAAAGLRVVRMLEEPRTGLPFLLAVDLARA